MTDNEINIAVAKASKLDVYAKHEWDERDDRRYFVCRRCEESIGWSKYSKDLPPFADPCVGDTNRNYVNSLDAMSEIEQSLASDEDQDAYANALVDNLEEEFCDLEGTSKHVFACATFTARQRAMAYLSLSKALKGEGR